MSHPSSAHENQPTKSGFDSQLEYSLIVFSGEDWKDWLQGQITNDIRNLTAEEPLEFCLCKPTGQMLAVGWIDFGGNMWVPTACVQAVIDRVEQMVILEDCQAQASDQRMSVRFPLTSKLPIWGVDMSETNFPSEMGPLFESRVMSYNKGCYTGQEVNHRIHTRGHTNKTWGVYTSTIPFNQGDPILNSDGDSVGTITRCEAFDSSTWLVGAIVKNGQIPALKEFQP